MMEAFPPEEQSLAMSVWGMGLLTSPMLGPTLGGWITYNWSWRWNFYINLPIGILAAVMVTIFVHDPEHIRDSQAAARKIIHRHHLPGSGSRAPADCAGPGTTFGLVLISVGLRVDCSRGGVSGCLGCARTSISRTDTGLEYPQTPLFDIPVTVILAMILAVYGMNLLNPLFFQELLDYSPWKSGLAVLPRGFGTLIGMLLIGQLSRRGSTSGGW